MTAAGPVLVRSVTMSADRYGHGQLHGHPDRRPGRCQWDGEADSTDALIILSADVGINTAQFCPMNCGDVNGDGAVNSTDALIILSFDVGISVPYPVGTGTCPVSVAQPAGCTP